METLIFVYGTLKKGFHAHRLMEDIGAKFIGERTTASRYHLFDQGNFPGMMIGDQTGGVHGELFSIPSDQQIHLDRYECVDEGLFTPELIELSDGSQALAYLYSGDCSRAKKVNEGVWHE